MTGRHGRIIGVLAAGAVMAAGLGILHYAGGDSRADAGGSSPTDPAPQRRVPVVVTLAGTRTFEERLVIQGNLEAKTYAVVAARTPGTLEQLYVDEGDRVVAGETELFQVDALKVSKALEVRKQELAVTRCASKEKEANLERVEADFHKAELDYRRFQRLFKQKVVSEDALEQRESRYKQTRAMLKHARTLIELGMEQERQAAAAVAIAEKDLSDSLVSAPISGIVNRRFREAGESVEVGKPLLRIEDPSVLEASVFLPAQYYPRIVEGETKMRVHVYGIDVGERAVSYKSPAIHPRLRTFEVKCVIDGPPAGVVPGALAEIQILLERKDALGIPAGAVQVRGDVSVLFVVTDGKARMIPVETGLETDGWLEVSSQELTEGTPVITMGQYLVNDGSPVAVREGNV